MGLFDKIKSTIQKQTESIKDSIQKKEEEKRQQEEEKRKQEEERRQKEAEAKRFNPAEKSLEWFSSEDGIKAFNDYITAQNYILEETIKKEKERKYPDYDLDLVIKVAHKDAKLPYIYFKNLVDKIEAQALNYVGPTNLVLKALSIQAKPFYIDDDGEPQPVERIFTPEEIVSIEKNPLLNYVANFKCFDLKDDAQGSWKDKYELWSNIAIWLSIYGHRDKNIIANNPWIFENDTYFNSLGTVKKLKAFCKKAIESATVVPTYFEEKLNECE